MPGSSLCPCTERQVYWYATLPFFTFVLFCFVLFCFVLFCFVLFCFVLFCFVLFCFVLFCFVLFCFVLFCFVLFCFVLFCFVLFCFVLFCFVLFISCFPPPIFWFILDRLDARPILSLRCRPVSLLCSFFSFFLSLPVSSLSYFTLPVSSLFFLFSSFSFRLWAFPPSSVFCTPYPLGLLVASCCLFPRYCVRFIRSLCCFSFLLFFFFFFFFFYFFFFFFPFFFFCSHVVLQRL